MIADECENVFFHCFIVHSDEERESGVSSGDLKVQKRDHHEMRPASQLASQPAGLDIY